MKDFQIETQSTHHTNARFTQVAWRLVILATTSLASLSLAGTPGRDQVPAADKTERISTVAATAMAIEAFRELQGAMIDADFQRDLRATALGANRQAVANLTQLAAKKRELRRQKLAGQLANMEQAYRALVASTTAKPAPPLNLALAATQLRTIAAGAADSPLDPHKAMLVTAIMHPLASQAATTIALTSNRSYSPVAGWIASAITVAQHIEVQPSCLALLAVLAVFVIHRMSQLAGVASRAYGPALLRQS